MSDPFEQTAVNRRLAEHVRAARLRLGLTQEQVAERLGVPRSAVSDIEAAKRELSAAELLALSRLFGESLEELLGVAELEAGADEVMLRAASVPASARDQLREWMRLCETYRDLEQMLGEERCVDLRPVAGMLSSFEQAQDLADEERGRLALGVTPAHVLLGVLEERVGIKVFHLDLDDALSGASVASARFGPAILVNRRHTPGRRVFTLAHELFHLLVRGPVVRAGQSLAWHVCDVQRPDDGKDRVEQLADRFAGRLLVPPDHFIERLRLVVRPGGSAEPVDLIALARYFGVSVQAVFVQLALLKLAPWDLAMNGYRDPAFQEHIVQAGPETAAEPQRFRRLVIKAYVSERISKGKLAELLAINVADVDDVLQRHGAGGSDRGISIALPR